MAMYDAIIVGAGPGGLSCGIEASKHGLQYLIIEKGGIADAIRRFPTNMTFFSTPNLLSLGDLPFVSLGTRPNRAEALNYYRGVCEYFGLKLRLNTRVVSAAKREQHFEIQTESGEHLQCRNLVLALGYFDLPSLLGIPGEESPHVRHFYEEPFMHSHSKVVVVGGANSAVEAALDLHRHGAEVTLIHRGSSLSDSIKYWVRPDIENRIKEGSIKTYFNTTVREIEANKVHLDGTREVPPQIPADAVYLLTGYYPDTKLFSQLDVRFDPETLIPKLDDSYQSSVEGVFIAGSATCGCETGNIFIENGRLHSHAIFAQIGKTLDKPRIVDR